MDDRSLLGPRHVLVRPARHHGALRQASKRVWVAGSCRLSAVEPLAGAHTTLYLLRSLFLATVGNRGADVRGGLPGNLHRVRQRDRLRSPPSAMDAIKRPASARRPGVWHRGVPRRHPVALGGGSACRRGLVDPRGGAAPARHPAASGGADRGRSGLAGLCALLRTAARACLEARTSWQGKPPAPLTEHYLRVSPPKG